MKKLVFSFIIVVLIVIGLIALARPKQNGLSTSNNQNSKLSIVTSFYPLADFAEHVGGDLVNVINITPAGAEPHDYEPTPQDIANVYSAKVFLYNGNGVDAWADKLADDLRSKNILVIKMSDQVNSLQSNTSDAETGPLDPHFWLDPLLASTEVDRIAQALIQADPTHANQYTNNRDTFKQQLVQLDQEYKSGLAQCTLHQIVTSHNAFQYLGKRYGFTSLYISGLSPDEEPSPQKMAKIVDIAKQQKISYIFFETLVNPKLADTVAQELNAKTLVLNPIEGLTDADMKTGKDYLSVMRDNLANLRLALQCP